MYTKIPLKASMPTFDILLISQILLSMLFFFNQICLIVIRDTYWTDELDLISRWRQFFSRFCICCGIQCPFPTQSNITYSRRLFGSYWGNTYLHFWTYFRVSICMHEFVWKKEIFMDNRKVLNFLSKFFLLFSLIWSLNSMPRGFSHLGSSSQGQKINCHGNWLRLYKVRV